MNKGTGFIFGGGARRGLRPRAARHSRQQGWRRQAGQDRRGGKGAPATASIASGSRCEGTPRGAADAKVAIVAFSDFQCPFCSRVVPTMDQIEKTYGKQVRLYFRHNPLPMHHDAPLASEAAVAAEAQGKFWEMHDKLFANQQNLKRPDLEKYAQEIGLDMGKFKEALDTRTRARPASAATWRWPPQIGAQGTPNFYIDGRNLQGAQPFDEFKKVIDDEIERADKLHRQGRRRRGRSTPPFMKGAKAPGAGGQARAAGQGSGRQRRGLQGRRRRRADQGRQAAEGHDHRVLGLSVPVLQPRGRRRWRRCSRTTARRADRVPPQPAPLPQQRHAGGPGGRGGEGAGEVLADARQAVRQPAEPGPPEPGQATPRNSASTWRSSRRRMDKEKGKERIKRDMDDAAKFGARGTPNFFINGRNFRGAQPLEAFKARRRRGDQEGRREDRRRHAARTGLRGAHRGRPRQGGRAAAPPPGRGEPDANTRFRADIKGAPMKGAKDAPVTIVQFSDYQCPFCSRVEPTINQVMDDVQGQGPRGVARPAAAVPPERDAGRDRGRAPPASRASTGRCTTRSSPTSSSWTAAPTRSTRRSWGSTWASSRRPWTPTRARSDRGRRGRRRQDRRPRHAGLLHQRQVPLGGAAVRVFKAKIDEELKIADALVAKGTPKAKVYDVLMKDAKAEVAAAPAGAGGEEKGPEADTEVYKVVGR